MTLEEYRSITEQKRWRSHAALLSNGHSPKPEDTDPFSTYWIEGGHHMREQISDDRELVRLLRHMLPPYKGVAIELFRGENKSRWESGTIGPAWTSNAEIARDFASGLNAVFTGGVLLKAKFEPLAIISGPNAHSKYLGEDQFTVDSLFLPTVSVVETFPPVM